MGWGWRTPTESRSSLAHPPPHGATPADDIAHCPRWCSVGGCHRDGPASVSGAVRNETESALLVYNADLAMSLAVVGGIPISASQAIPNYLGLSTVGEGRGCEPRERGHENEPCASRSVQARRRLCKMSPPRPSPETGTSSVPARDGIGIAVSMAVWRRALHA